MGIPFAEVIGDPIAHSKSPLIHKFWLEKLGLPYDFRTTRVRPGELGDFFETRRLDPDWCGCSVTLPHKTAAAGLVAELRETARAIGAVNCVTRLGKAESRLVGHNTDVGGFLEPLQSLLGREDEIRTADVIGAGGAASAVCYALDRNHFSVLSYARSTKQARNMRRMLGMDHEYGLVLEIGRLSDPAMFWGTDDPDRLQLLVNSTPLGMTGFPALKIRLPDSRNMIVYDLVYSPLETPLLRAARERGMTAIDGLGMLVGQAAAAFEIFFMEAAPREHDAELRELLTR